MTRIIIPIFAILLFFSVSGCKQSRPASPEATTRFESVIPRPATVTMSGGAFLLTSDARIILDGTGDSLQRVVNFLAEKLRTATGFDLPVTSPDEASGSPFISLSLSDGGGLGAEGYELSVHDNGVDIRANSAVGLFWGVQTLRQLLPEAIERKTTVEGEWEIATGTISDTPTYAWRGSMLDVARHFFSVEEVKHYIDLISLYKINVLHLHLSDDQGWRIEIKSWPNLTAIGGRFEVGGGEGGFYTQQDYKEIVDYAQNRFITVIPEIDMPGHINAALVSYKELNPGPEIVREPGSKDPSRPVAGQVYTGIQVGFSTLDIKKDVTFEFVNDVLRELALITPGPYLHIGGDEAAVTKKPDYIAFINRFKTIVEANGKKMIGWEEIAQGDIDSTVTVQHWHSQAYAKMAAEKGAKLIYSPAQKVYLDMQYDSTTKLGLHWAAYIEVDSSYMWDPATRVDGIDPAQIRGVEAPLWSETLADMDDVEYMLFPRLAGVAEVGWTSAGKRNWDDYKVRLAHHGKRWDVMGVDYYPSPKVPWETDNQSDSQAHDDAAGQ